MLQKSKKPVQCLAATDLTLPDLPLPDQGTRPTDARKTPKPALPNNQTIGDRRTAMPFSEELDS